MDIVFLPRARLAAGLLVLGIYLAGLALLPGDIARLLGLALFALEVAALWPLAVRLKPNPAAPWLTALAVLPLGLAAIVVQSSLALTAVVFAASSLWAALVLARLLDPNIRHSAWERVQAWLRRELGEPPGAWWAALAWAALGLALLDFAFVRLFVFMRALLGSLTTGTLADLAVPLACLAAAGHRLATRPPQARRARQVILEGLAAVSAVLLYFALFRGTLVALLVALALAASRRGSLSSAWRTLIVGGAAGVALVGVLGSPLREWAYAEFVPGSAPASQPAVLACVLAGLLVLAVGALAAAWGGARGWTSRLAAGAAAGGIAALFVFVEIGAPIAGLAAQVPLYGMALSRAGYGPGEWLLKLAIALNNTFPATYAVFWLLAAGGALLGGWAGCWRRSGPRQPARPKARPRCGR